MPVSYAIPITEDTLDLIQVLNGGVRPALEEKPTYFSFDVDSDAETTNHKIKFQEDLYDRIGDNVGHGYVIRIFR